MKVKTKEFAAALAKVTRNISTKTMLPILANVKLEEKSGKLELTTTDLATRIAVTMEAEFDGSGFAATTVSGRKLSSLVSRFGAETTTLEQDNGKLMMKNGSASFSLLTLPAADFPQEMTVENTVSYACDGRTLSGILSAVSCSASKDNSRPSLCCIQLTVDGNDLTAVATDGKRLMVSRNHCDNPGSITRSALIPWHIAGMIATLFATSEKVEVMLNGKVQILRDRSSGITFSHKLKEAPFPNWQQIVPEQDVTQEVTVDCLEITRTLERVGMMIDSMGFVKLERKADSATLLCSAESSSIGSGSEEVQARGAAFSCCFNPAYLLDFFKLAGVNAIFSQKDAVSPCRFDVGGYTAVIMPIRKK